MKKLIYRLLRWCFGKKQFYRFFLILKNISLQGLNYRNSDIRTNGELFLINELAHFYRNEKELILFDVGANAGHYSKILADTFKEQCTIYSFEPFSVPFSALKTLSGQYPMIKPQKIGLSDKEEELLLYSSEHYSEIGGLYDRNMVLKEVSLDKKELNRFKTISSFCDEKKISHIHFLKIDVEGHELHVLKGAASLLKNKHIDFIQFEFGSGNYFSKTFFLDFFEFLNQDYVLCFLLKNGLIKINEYHTDLEMQILTNFVAVHKSQAGRFLDKHHVS